MAREESSSLSSAAEEEERAEEDGVDIVREWVGGAGGGSRTSADSDASRESAQYCLQRERETGR
jgi:hypothetical protein